MELFGSNFNLFRKREASLSPAGQAKAGVPVTTDPNHPTNQQQKQDGGGSFEERIVYAGHPRVALTVSASALFPVTVALSHLGAPEMIPMTVISAVVTAIFIIRHKDNIIRSFKKQEPTTKDFLKKLFGKHRGVLVEEAEAAKQEQQ